MRDWILADLEEGGFIIAPKEDLAGDFLLKDGRRLGSVQQWDTREKAEAAIGDTLTCSICGKLSRLHFMESCKQQLLKANQCHTCNHFTTWWADGRESNKFVIDGWCYTAAARITNPGPHQSIGFGGREFTFVPLDGSVPVSTNNAWCAGDLRLHPVLRQMIPDNATMGKGAPPVYMQ